MKTWGGERWDAGIKRSRPPSFAAHISLAVDSQNRLWAAWNERGLNSGKDTGFLLEVEATLLYEFRSIRVAVKDGFMWHEPVADVNAAMSPYMEWTAPPTTSPSLRWMVGDTCGCSAAIGRYDSGTCRA